MDYLKILLCEENEFIRRDFRNFFSDKDVQVHYCCKNGNIILDEIAEFCPYVVITDIFISGIDGIALCEKAKTLKTPPLMFLALSYIDSDNIINLALKNGFDYYFVKPTGADTIYNRIMMILNDGETVENNDDDIVSSLHYIGIPTHLIGYRCIKTAINLVLQHPDIIHKVTTKLYPAIAEIHNTTARRVERAIRTAVEITWDKGNETALKEIFPYHFDNFKRPSSSEFIATVCDYIKVEYKICNRY